MAASSTSECIKRRGDLRMAPQSTERWRLRKLTQPCGKGENHRTHLDAAREVVGIRPKIKKKEGFDEEFAKAIEEREMVRE